VLANQPARRAYRSASAPPRSGSRVVQAKDQKRLLRLQRQLTAYQLLIIDELGYVPPSTTGAEVLLEVFSRRRCSGQDSNFE
jgi:DNA replication protein DnaC